jgi:hypothetical protein
MRRGAAPNPVVEGRGLFLAGRCPELRRGWEGLAVVVGIVDLIVFIMIQLRKQIK